MLRRLNLRANEVHADSSLWAIALDTLNLADHVLVLGTIQDEKDVFNFGGWCRLELSNGSEAWVLYESVAINRPLVVESSGQDTLYEEPDLGSDIVTTIDEIRPFWVYQRSIQDNGLWLKATCGYYKGWLKVDTLDYMLETALLELLIYYLGYGSPSLVLPVSGPHRDLEKALDVAHKLSAIADPLSTIYRQYTIGYQSYYPLGAGAVIEYYYHSIYHLMERYDEAISNLQTIVNLYSTQQLYNGPAGPIAALRIGEIYFEDIGDLDKAIEEYHFVITEYPDISIYGFEWNDWVDIRAAERIVSMLGNNPVRLEMESRQIINESPNPPVQMIGYVGIIKSMGQRGLCDDLLQISSEAINRHPDVQRGFFKTVIDYASYVAAAAFQALEDNVELAKFIQFGRSLEDQYQNLMVAPFAASKVAELADKTNSDIHSVIKKYEHVCATTSEFWIFDPISRVNYSHYLANARIKELKEANIVEAQTTGATVDLRLGHGEKFPSLMQMNIGDMVAVLYPDDCFVKHFNGTSGYTKVKQQDGIIGWVPTANLQFHWSPICDEEKEASTWNMYLANSENRPAFSGPEIRNPVVLDVLWNYTVKGLRFYHINGDQVPDLILHKGWASPISALDGVTRDIFWEIESYEEYSVIADGKLFLRKFYYGRGFTDIECYDLQTGELVWLVSTDTRIESYLIAFEEKLYAVFADSTLLCSSSLDGHTLWASKINIQQGSYTYFGVNSRGCILSTSDSIFALNLDDGSLKWAIGLYHSSDVPVLDQDAAYFCSAFGVTAVNLDDGSVKWEFGDFGYTMKSDCPPLPNEDKVYCVSYHKIFALDRETGELLWSKKLEGTPRYSPIAVGKTLLVSFSQESLIRAFDSETGDVLWSLPLSNVYQPIYQYGMLYVNGSTGTVIIGNGPSTSVDSHEFATTTDFNLMQNYPNPFNPRTTIRYQIPKAGHVALTVYNILGQTVDKLVNEFKAAGNYSVEWDASDKASGVYLYQIVVGEYSAVKKCVVLK